MDTINSKKFEVIVEEELHINKLPRLDRWLAKKIESNPRLPDLSRTRLTQLILDGFVTQNGETIRDPSTIVKHLQKYIIVIPEASPALPLPETIDLKIVYEDNWKTINKINTSIKLPITVFLSSKDYNKIQLFEKTLNDLDLVSDFYVLHFDNSNVFYKVIYNGSPNKFLIEFDEKGLKIIKNEDNWQIK